MDFSVALRVCTLYYDAGERWVLASPRRICMRNPRETQAVGRPCYSRSRGRHPVVHPIPPRALRQRERPSTNSWLNSSARSSRARHSRRSYGRRLLGNIPFPRRLNKLPKPPPRCPLSRFPAKKMNSWIAWSGAWDGILYRIGTFRVGALLDVAARRWAHDVSACSSGQEDMVRLTVSSGAALYIEDQRTW